MAYLCYLMRRGLAIALGLCLTGYSAWASWSHQGDLIGPLAAISAAVLLAYCEYALRDRQWVHFLVLGSLGIAAAVFSASIVLERVSHSQEGRLQAARSSNLPRQLAERSLAEAKAELAKAEAVASKECGSGRGARCASLEQREAEARRRVEAERSKLVGLGATVAVNPAAAMLGAHAETIQLAVLLGLPLWLELAAPAVLAYGFAPAPRKEAPKPKKKAKRRKVKPAPRKPAAPAKATGQRPALKLVAANDH